MKKSALFVALFIAHICFAQTEAQTTIVIPKVPVAELPIEPTKTTRVDSDEKYSDNNFGVSLFSLGGLDRSQITNGNGDTPSMYFFENYLSFSYKIKKDFRLEARYSFNYSTAGTDKSGKDATDKADTRDASLLMGFSRVFEDYLPENVSYSFKPRLYLPTSEKSKAQGMITSLRLENVFKIYTNKYSFFRFGIAPHYFFQRSTAYVDDRGNVKTTDMFQLKTAGEYNWSLSKRFSIKPGFEFDDSWSNSSSANNGKEYRNTLIDYRLGLEVKFGRPLSFTVGYSHRKDLLKTDEFTDGFTLMTNATLY